MTNEPKDYEREKEVQKVQDLLLESRIKWGVIAQGLILFAVTGIIMLGFNFGGRFMDGVDKINYNLVEIRQEISDISTGVEVNTIKIDNNSERINSNEKEISDNSKAIQDYLNGHH